MRLIKLIIMQNKTKMILSAALPPWYDNFPPRVPQLLSPPPLPLGEDLHPLLGLAGQPAI